MTDVVAMDPRLLTNFSHLIPPHWLTEVRADIPHREYFTKGRFQGKSGSKSMIIENDDFKTAPGNVVTVTVEGENYGNGVTNEAVMSGNEFPPQTNQFTVTVAEWTNAEALSRQSNETIMKNEIIAAGPRLSRWAGKKRDELVMAELLDPAGGVDPKILYGGAATSDATLSATCMLEPDLIDMAKLAIEIQAKPLEVSDSVTGEILEKFVMIADPFSCDKLFSNTTWRNAIQNAMERGFSHPLFTGALGQWNDIIIRKYTQINVGAHQGTPQRPECITTAIAGGDYTNASGKAYLCVGADNGIDYTKYFPETGTININKAGTIYTYTYSAKTDNAFTLDTPGTLQESQETDDSRVTAINHRSQLIVSGAEACIRAMKMGDRPLENSEDYGRRRGIGIAFNNGTRVVENSVGTVTGYLLIDVWALTPKFSI